MIDFSDIGYLATGNQRQKRVYKVLVDGDIMRRLASFDPILIGTFPIGIDVASSDLDIGCCFESQTGFIAKLESEFSNEQAFMLRKANLHGLETVVCNFIFSGYEFEIFGQPLPVRSQMGYRHMVIEYKILEEKGETFRSEIIRLKLAGMKTEPAFAQVLQLEGDPYLALLEFE
ncbi:DUF4269 domain-containing protein [Flavobacterium selenitireducens]|uniref:DUF4269 domain-containing protein n=1 Tax=Flavobacterium selenitireducens TaxID=2722704 RepID=UPI00168B2C69|nr:DUF4269 domain-containing protein [Flavobacterium selenitireducens]MBD3581502.1 DUF4269 domain-containing protein [Flavobacterium selenitireducens]